MIGIWDSAVGCIPEYRHKSSDECHPEPVEELRMTTQNIYDPA